MSREGATDTPTLIRLAERMNADPAKRVWAAYQRVIGAPAIAWATRHILHVHGLEHLEGVTPERPLLIVANHRTMFDLFVVSTVLLRTRPAPWRLFFPVRGRYCYRSARGVLVNAVIAGWSMYPPFFREPGTRRLDHRMLERLVVLLREGHGHVVGFHPEGTRNRGADPYALLPPQPGVGQLVLAARPLVLPVFVAGLTDNLVDQLRANREGGERVRVHFGAPVPDDAYDGIPENGRGYRAVAEDLMQRIAALGAQDRAMYADGDNGPDRGDDRDGSDDEALG